MSKKWDKDKIIEVIQRFNEEHDRPPKIKDFQKSGGNYPSAATVQRYFGSWNKAIEGAGFSPNKWTNDEIIEAIRLFYKEHGKVPINTDFDKSEGKYPSKTTVQNQFGSWNKALEAAGFSPNQIRKEWTNDEIVESIQRFNEEWGRPPQEKDFQKSDGKYPSTTTVVRQFESWNKAIEAAGFSPNNKTWTNDEIIEAIQLFNEEQGRPPIEKDFIGSESKYPSYSTVANQFGSWNDAIEASGFEPDYNTGFGTRTVGKDGHRYLSKAEAHFADTFLFDQYKYKKEPKYPKPHNLLRYDWYIYELDCYIELDGGIRPDVIPKKIEINKGLGRTLLVIPTKDIYKKDFTLKKVHSLLTKL